MTHTITIHGANRTTVVTLQEVAPGEWKQIGVVVTEHLAPPVEESQRRYPDGRPVHPDDQPQELPPTLEPADLLGDFQLKQAAIDAAKKEARK